MLRIASVLTLLTGCANVTTISTIERDRFSRDQFAFAVADGPLRAVVRNNPFADDRDDSRLLGAVAASSPLAMRLDKAPVGRQFDYRLVLQFGARAYRPDVAGGAVDVCRDSPVPQSVAAADSLDFAVAFCRGEGSIGQVHGRLPRPTSPDDPVFRRALGMVMAALLLPTNQLLEPDFLESALENRRYGRYGASVSPWRAQSGDARSTNNSVRLSGVLSVSGSSPGNAAARMRVRVGPGETKFTRILVWASSAAQVSAMDSSAAFEAA